MDTAAAKSPARCAVLQWPGRGEQEERDPAWGELEGRRGQDSIVVLLRHLRRHRFDLLWASTW